LVIVEVDEGPVNLFSNVFFLLKLEDVLVELLLQLLVGVVLKNMSS
jgi:hypothetical protein